MAHGVYPTSYVGYTVNLLKVSDTAFDQCYENSERRPRFYRSD